MNDNMPHTPFSTPLSSSARETELRIRNIMSGPKKRPPILFLILVFSLCLFCGNLVSCQRQPVQPTLVMETQYYDSDGNYLEIPALALPAGEENEAVDTINAALNDLREEYTQLSSRMGTDALENQCLFYPSSTDQYLNLLFFQSQFTTDLNTGHIFSLVYDVKEGTLVSAEDALALAGLNKAALLNQVAEQMEPEMNPEGQTYQIALHNLTLEGFRIKADGQPVFYLTGRMDDADDAVMDAVSGADQLFIWMDRTATIYDQYGLSAPLVPAEETDKLDPPLWNQWYFAGEEPVGGFVDRPALEALNYDVWLNEMALNYLQAEYNTAVYLAADAPEQPQERDCRLDFAACLGTDTLDGESLGLYQIDYSRYQQRSGELNWLEWSPAYLVARMYEDGAPAEFLVRFDYYQEGMAPGDAIRQAVWGLYDLEVCLFRDGYSTPAGPANDLSNPAVAPLVRERTVWEDAEPIYWPGDYWFDATGDGISARCYYSHVMGTEHIYQFDTTRTDMYTPRSIRVGSTRADIAAAYPEAHTNGYPWDMFGPLMWYCGNEEGWGGSIIFFFDDNADGSDTDVVSRIVLNYVLD